MSLTAFLRHGRRDVDPPGAATNSGRVRAIEYRSADLALYRATVGSGVNRRFIAWLEDGPLVEGPSAVYPWAHQREGYVAEFDNGSVVRSVSQGWGQRDLVMTVGSESTRYVITARGLTSSVEVSRHGDGVLAVLRDSASYSLEMETVVAPDVTVQLALIGSGLGRRTCRQGLIMQQLTHY